MKRLTLVRHAKSSWQDNGLSDHQRPLNKRGQNDAPTMAQRMQKRGSIPDQILCSSATRTRQTCAIFLNSWRADETTPIYHDALYLATTGTMQSLIEHTEASVAHLMIIAHNPGLEQLALLLHESAPQRLPTCAMVHFEFEQDDFTLHNPDSISLGWYDFPKNQD